MDSLDLVQLRNDSGVVGWERAETAHALCSSLHVVLLDIVTGGLREDEHTTGQDGSPDELNG